MNLVKFVSIGKKLHNWIFECTWNFGHTTGFLTFEKGLLILLILIIHILTQTDNYKYRKSVATKKVLFEKMGLSFETLNSTFYIK